MEMYMKPVSLDRSPLHLLHRTMQRADDLFCSQINGLTSRQFAVLIAIDENLGANQQDLTIYTGIDRSTISEIVRRLGRRGLVRRKRNSKDRRAFKIVLTDEGRELLAVSGPIAKDVDDGVLDALPSARRGEFLDLLSEVVRKLTPQR
jgi:MarR family transcriptional regulator, temperature-dependent positive regulator of motility